MNSELSFRITDCEACGHEERRPPVLASLGTAARVLWTNSETARSLGWVCGNCGSCRLDIIIFGRDRLMAWVVDDRGRERALSIGESYREALRCVAAELAHISDPGAFVVRIEDTEGDGIWLPVSWLPGNLLRPKAYFHRILRLLKARSVWQRNRLRRFFRQPLVVQIDTAVWDLKRLAIRVGIIKEKIPF